MTVNSISRALNELILTEGLNKTFAPSSPNTARTGAIAANVLGSSDCLQKQYIAVDFLQEFLPEHLYNSLASIVTTSDQCAKDLHSCFLTIKHTDPSLVEATHDHLLTCLLTISDREKLRTLAGFILKHATQLLIEPTSNLIDESRVAMAYTDPENTTLANPFKIFNKFTDKVRPEVAIPLQHVCDKKLTLGTQKRAVPAVPCITFGQLPKYVSRAKVIEMFDVIERKLTHSSRTHIITTFAKPFETLKENFAGPGGFFLKSLLNTRGEKDALVPKEVARFFAIMKYVFDMPEQVIDCGLTLREMCLLNIAATICDCPTGKREDICELYFDWIAEGKIVQNVSIPLFLDQVYQRSVQKLLYTNEVLRDFVGVKEGDVFQQTHQVLFVKNVLYESVQLDHESTWDIGTDLLYPDLINKSREEIFTLFYKHLTPKYLINALAKTEIPKTLKDSIDLFFDELNIPNAQTMCWDKNHLSEYGAMVLLLNFEYLSELI